MPAPSSRVRRDPLDLSRGPCHFSWLPSRPRADETNKGRKNGMEDCVAVPQREDIYSARRGYMSSTRARAREYIRTAVRIRVVHIHTSVTLTPRINIPYALFARGFADCQWRAAGMSRTLRKHRAREDKEIGTSFAAGSILFVTQTILDSTSLRLPWRIRFCKTDRRH